MCSSPRIAFFLLVAPVISLSAAAQAQEIPLSGSHTDLRTLEGTWCGTYESKESGRYGALRFRLEADADTAYGAVWMFSPPPAEGVPAPEPERLSVHFVEVEPGVVRGVMAPYDDPEWGCELETRFTGWVGDDVIEGAFVSCGTRVETVPHVGRWRAHRLADPNAACYPFTAPHH